MKRYPVPELMPCCFPFQVAITKKSKTKLDPLLTEKGYFLRPSGFESRPVSVSRPVARNTSWYCHKAWSMMRQGRRDKAATESPQPQLGTALTPHSGHNGQAIAHYEGAVKVNPRHLRSHFNRGVLYEELGQYSKAPERLLIEPIGTSHNILNPAYGWKGGRVFQ